MGLAEKQIEVSTSGFFHHGLKLLFDKGPIFLTQLFSAALIFFVAIVVARLASRSIRNLLQRRESHTLAPVAATVTRILIVGGGLITALSQVGINVGAILAGAGIVGLAVGFGAQTLVKDLLSGFFLIFDDVIAVGDTIIVDSIEGIVESVGMRMTAVRAFDGKLWYFPNGSITRVGNASRDWSRVVVEVGVAYDTDIDRALLLLKQIADELAQEKPAQFIEPPQSQGILSLGDSAVNLRVVAKVRPVENAEIERELRKRIKIEFAANQIEIPFPHRVVIEKAMSVQPLGE